MVHFSSSPSISTGGGSASKQRPVRCSSAVHPAEPESPEPQDEHQRDLLRRYPGLAELVRRGSIRLGGPNRPEIYELMPAALEGITSAELLD